jgi:hypothetical protein
LLLDIASGIDARWIQNGMAAHADETGSDFDRRLKGLHLAF